jgi:hypothetical protein
MERGIQMHDRGRVQKNRGNRVQLRDLLVLFSYFLSKLPIFNGPVADAERTNEVITITAILPGGHSQYMLLPQP